MKYIEAELDIIAFEAEDVITESPLTNPSVDTPVL